MKRRLRLLSMLCLAGLSFMAIAAEETEGMTEEAFLSGLNFQSGQVMLANNLATLDMPANFRYLSPEDTEKVLVMAWGNPPGSETLGMIVPAEISLFDDNGWAAIIQYEEDGYVSDEDAFDMDYDQVLADMQANTEENNEAREAAGYGAVYLKGWAAKPHYDATSKKLYWAKELQFGEDPVHTLNYKVRMLGRRGVLVINMVGVMEQLATIEAAIPDIMLMTEFNPGNRYADFDPDIDEVAAYGIGALVAGKLAAKAGLLAKLGVLLLAGKQFIVIILIAIAGLFAKLFRRKKGV